MNRTHCSAEAEVAEKGSTLSNVEIRSRLQQSPTQQVRHHLAVQPAFSRFRFLKIVLENHFEPKVVKHFTNVNFIFSLNYMKMIGRVVIKCLS